MMVNILDKKTDKKQAENTSLNVDTVRGQLEELRKTTESKTFKIKTKDVWKRLCPGEKSDAILMENILIDIIETLFPDKNGKFKRSYAKQHDLCLLMFGLLDGYYHTEVINNREMGVRFEERCNRYLDKSDYIKLEYPNRGTYDEINTWRKEITRICEENNLEEPGEIPDPRNAVQQIVGRNKDKISKKLLERINDKSYKEYSRKAEFDEKTRQRKDLPKPRFVLENFSPIENHKFAAIDEYITTNTKNTTNAEDSIAQQTGGKIGTNRTEPEVKQESTAATMGDKPNKDSQLKLNLKIILLAIAFIALIIGFVVFVLKKHYAPPNESEENTVNNLEVSEENDNSETQVNGDIINYNIENMIVGDYIQSIPMDTSDSLSVGEYIDQSIVIEALEEVLSTSLMNQNAQLDYRPLYTQKEIDDDGLRYLTKDGKVTFNSIKDPNAEFYDEQYFVGVRVDDGDHGKDNVWSHDRITAKDGETYVIRSYIHNNAISSETNWKEDGRGVAHNTKVAFNLPQISDTKINVHGIVSATNAVPQEIRDNIVFESENDQKFHLEYVYGSALLENNGIGSKDNKNKPEAYLGRSGYPLSDDIVKAKSGGTLIGYDALNGEFPGCYQFFSFVTIKVKVVYDSTDSYTLNKTVRLVGDKNSTWTDSLTTAKIGDTVEYQIAYENTGTETQENVMILDKLPANLEYIPGTTKLWNAKHDGLVDKKDAIFSTGINIGNYAPGANAYIRLRAKIVDINLEQDSNTLTNWVKGSTNHIVLQDFANVIVFKSDEP